MRSEHRTASRLLSRLSEDGSKDIESKSTNTSVGLQSFRYEKSFSGRKQALPIAPATVFTPASNNLGFTSQNAIKTILTHHAQGPDRCQRRVEVMAILPWNTQDWISQI